MKLDKLVGDRFKQRPRRLRYRQPRSDDAGRLYEDIWRNGIYSSYTVSAPYHSQD